MGNGLGNEDGTVSQRMIDYFEARARGGLGLIILGSISVDHISPFKGIPALWDDKFIPGLRELTKTVHAHRAKVIPQLCHPGGITHLDSVMLPSNFSLEDIKRIIEQFSDAAKRAKEVGFDGVELHASGGFMVLGSFISALRNRRTDAYGGSVEGRLKLLQEVIRTIRDKEGRDFPIIIRISAEELVPGGRTIRETQYIAPILAEAGINAFDITPGMHGDSYSHSHTAAAMGDVSGPMIAFSKAVKEVVDVPVTVGGKINNPRFAENILERNEADLIIMGRALLADPELPNKAAEGRFDDIAPCVGCGLCTLRPGVLTCLVNPALGREKEMVITAAAKPKKVLVAGGGPAGLMAASRAALRGHKVTLYEKRTELGGQFNLAAVAPTKQEMTRVIQYLSVQMKKAGVKVQLNTEVTPELVKKTEPDVVIVATGGEPFVPDIPGAKGNRIVTAHDVLAGKVTIRPGNVVVIGGGLVGCEVADLLADLGDNMPGTRIAVTIVEMLEEIGLDIGGAGNRPLLLQRLREKGVRILTSAKVKEFIEDGIVIVRGGKEEPIHGADSIILAMGARSVDRLSGKIKNKVAEVYVIGDAKEPRRASEAIAEGAEVARNI
jgi:2,4-dienoyl-CoA reductase-like NADH-dependent reductase (Old Yellow Enzyme family)/thioredoxin reductase